MSNSDIGSTEWPADPEAYEMSGKIGQGAFATVWIAKQKTTDVVCAVKVLNLDDMDADLSEIRQEVQAMRLLSHPNVLTCHAAFVNNRDLWVVTPLMKKGSSLNSLQAARRILREQQQVETKMEDHIRYILHETLVGLAYIHENGQIHRDIKAGNILVDSDGSVKIADFGVSGFLIQAGSQIEKARTFVGTPCWMSPEVMEQMHGYDYRADVWSLGITALELAKGYAPYAKYPPMKVLILTIQEDPPSLASYHEEVVDEDDEVMEEYSSQFEAMVAMCLQKNPSKRPTCPELLTSKHFASFKKPEFREQRRLALQTEICDIVPDVGGSREIPPGHTPIFPAKADDRPAGTTWVFADGSQVLDSNNEPAEVDDVLAALDEFGKQTGGEHYTKVEALEDNDEDNDDNDDIYQFMDEFEQTTAGEHFRRN